MKTRAEWFYQAQWGLFMHFLAIPAGCSDGHTVTIESWNRQVDAFDVETLAAQLHQLKAGYLFLTLGQNSGYFCSPNAAYDRLTGRSPEQSKCSRRDLVADLHAALARYNIPLLVYLPTHAPMGDEEAIKALECIPPWDFRGWSPMNPDRLKSAASADSRIKTFQRNWEAIIREWSLRWGDKIKGWWFDGCYYADRLYDFPDEPNFSSFAAAIRAGNPDSLTAWNPGVKLQPVTISAEEDYTSGEVNEPEQVQCFGRWTDQAQFHILSYLGRTWGVGPLRFNAEDIAAHTRNVTDNGGVFTWDLPFDLSNGTLTPDVMTILKDFSARMAAPRRPRHENVPSIQLRETQDTPDAAEKTVELQLANPCGKNISGQIEFRIDPRDDFASLPGMTFSLTAGEKSSYRLNLRKLHPERPVTNVMLLAVCNGTTQRIAIPWPEEIVRPQLSSRYALYDRERNACGEVGFCITPDHKLQLAGTIYDTMICPQPRPWEGSCLEVFMLPADQRGQRTQLFLIPASEKNGAQVLRMEERDFPAVPDAAIATCQGKHGYDLSAELPLPEGMTENGIKLEMQLTVNTPHGIRRGHLFGLGLLSETGNFSVIRP